MIEEWRPVKGYEGLYEVSNLGRVKSLVVCRWGKYTERDLILKAQKNPRTGRYAVGLHMGGKTKLATVYRLVATAFVNGSDGKSEVNHIDGDKTNDVASNLEWVTGQENKAHARLTGLCKNAQVANVERRKPVRRSDGAVYESAYSAASDIGVSVCSIRDVLKGRARACKGFEFEYVGRQ